jgi:hypothetical protein
MSTVNSENFFYHRNRYRYRVPLEEADYNSPGFVVYCDKYLKIKQIKIESGFLFSNNKSISIPIPIPISIWINQRPCIIRQYKRDASLRFFSNDFEWLMNVIDDTFSSKRQSGYQ